MTRRLNGMIKSPKIKVALLGGAFDPITIGHVKVAQFVLSRLHSVEEVWFTPCHEHKYGKRMESAPNRVEMILKAIEGNNKLFCCDYEVVEQLSGATIETVRKMNKTPSFKHYDFNVIIGLDNANTFHKWVEAERLIKEVGFIVVPRRGVERDLSVNWYLEQPHVFLDAKTEIPEISSTEIRRQLKENRTVKPEQLDERVYQYILSNELYRGKYESIKRI